MAISLALHAEKEDWNNFVLERKGSIFHLWEWGKIIEQSLNYQKIFFISKDKVNNIDGILPFFFAKKGTFKYKLVSLPCTGYVNVLAKSLKVRQALLEAATTFSKKKKADLELYTTEKLNHLPKALSLKKSIFCTFLQKTSCDYQEIFKNKLDKNKRSRLKKIKRMKVEIKKANKQDLDQFYKMYLKMMEKIGELPLPRSFFELTFIDLEQHSLFLKSIHEKKVRAFLWSFIFCGTLYLWRNAYRRIPPKESIYLESLFQENIKIACSDKSIKVANSGIARCESGLAFYKTHWGFKPQQVFLINRL